MPAIMPTMVNRYAVLSVSAKLSSAAMPVSVTVASFAESPFNSGVSIEVARMLHAHCNSMHTNTTTILPR